MKTYQEGGTGGNSGRVDLAGLLVKVGQGDQTSPREGGGG